MNNVARLGYHLSERAMMGVHMLVVSSTPAEASTLSSSLVLHLGRKVLLSKTRKSFTGNKLLPAVRTLCSYYADDQVID